MVTRAGAGSTASRTRENELSPSLAGALDRSNDRDSSRDNAISTLDGNNQQSGRRSSDRRPQVRSQRGGSRNRAGSTSPTANGGSATRQAADTSGMPSDPFAAEGPGTTDESAQERLRRLTQDVMGGERDFEDVRRYTETLDRRFDLDADYGGPSEGFDPDRSDEWYADQGPEGHQERIRQIFGESGVGLQTAFPDTAAETGNQRQHRLTQKVLGGDLTFDEVREKVDMAAGQLGADDLWADYTGPAEQYAGMSRDEEFLDAGQEGVQERIRQIFGNRMVPMQHRVDEGVIPDASPSPGLEIPGQREIEDEMQHGFEDLPYDHQFHDPIAWTGTEEISDGYEDGTFRPGHTMTRQAALEFLYEMAGSPDVDYGGQFDDVGQDHQFSDAISWGAQEGITDGFDDGSFRPGHELSRQAAAAFMHRMAGEPGGSFDEDFSDVSPGDPFYDAQSWMADTGLTEGYDDGTFRSTDPLTRQAMAAFLRRADKRDLF